MSGDYIIREAAIKEMSHMMSECFPEAVEELDAVITTVKEIPAADVVEARHGKWINECQEGLGSFSAECSLCSKRTLAYFHYFYCPNCGAKMDGGQDDG